jgi:hypothetical protein
MMELDYISAYKEFPELDPTDYNVVNPEYNVFYDFRGTRHLNQHEFYRVQRIAVVQRLKEKFLRRS